MHTSKQGQRGDTMMRQLLLLAAIVLGVSAMRKHFARNAAMRDAAAADTATWENEGGAPAPQ
jgi:hypothetical protein